MTVLITLTTAGASTGPFDLYSDVDGYLVPFETLVPKASLVSGYISTLVPNGTTIVRVKSNSVCVNFIDITISLTTTTTSTSTSSSTSTTTSSTTETPIPEYYYYSIQRYDCLNNCSPISPELLGRSSTPLSTIDGTYYKIANSGFGSVVFQVQTTSEDQTFDVDMDDIIGTSSNCIDACNA